MKITKEIIDFMAPEHDRTSCSDSNLENGTCKIDELEVQGIVVHRKITQYPRCIRCFLLVELDNNGSIDPRIKFNIIVDVKHPKVKVISEE